MTQLSWESRGQGEELYVGLHGWGGSLRTFDPVVASLPPHARFVSISLPGYGDSPSPPSWELGTVVDMLAAQLAPLRGQRVTLVGNCSGAIFGMLACQRQRIALKRLILIDAFAFMPWYLRMLLWPLLGRFFYTMSFANPLGRWLTSLSLKLRKNAKKQTDMLGSFSAIDHRAAYETLRLLGKVGSYTQFADVVRLRGEEPAAVDIVCGAKSFGAIHRSASLWRRLWPHARLHVLASGGHLPIEEATQEVCDVLWENVAVSD